MSGFKVGVVDVLPIAEVDQWITDIAYHYRNLDVAAIRRCADWLDERTFERSTGKFIQSISTFLLRTPESVILVDTAVGNHKERPSQPAWHRLETDYMRRLRAAGVAPADVDIVLLSHLHADHVGWNTRLEQGYWVPTFPKAKYLMVGMEYEYWAEKFSSDKEICRGSFADSVVPIVSANMQRFVEVDHVLRDEPDGRIYLEHLPGHSIGNVLVHIEAPGTHLVLGADLFNHPVQVALPYLQLFMDYDADLALKNRYATIERYRDTDTIILPTHFPSPVGGRIVTVGDKMRFVFVDPSELTNLASRQDQ